jgi:hypothetical protein
MAKFIKVRQLFVDDEKCRSLVKIKYITDVTFFDDGTACLGLSLPSNNKGENVRTMVIECDKAMEQKIIAILMPETTKQINNGNINTGTQVPAN